MIYSLFYTLSFLVFFTGLLLRPRYLGKYLATFPQRLSFGLHEYNPSRQPSIWIHAVSVGETLAVSPALWVYDGDNADPTITYQWLRNGSAIPGAEASTYDLVPADASATISVTEIASGSNGTRSSTSLGVSIPTSSGTINAITATDPGGITIDYTGTLNIIAPDPSGARAEAN